MLKDINERALSQYKHIDMILSDKDCISDPRTIVTFFKILKSFIDIQIEIVEAFKDIENAKFVLEEKVIVHLLPIYDGVSNWICVLLDEFEEYTEKNQPLINEMWEILNVVDTVDIQYKLNGIPLMDCVLDVINKDVLIESLVDRNSEIVNRLERKKNNLDILIENFEIK